MSEVEAVALLASFASKVYDKFNQMDTNREEVASLQLRISLLINCLNDPGTMDARGRDAVGSIWIFLTRAERLADEFAARAGDRLHQFVWSDRYAQRCASINAELARFIQLLGVASDRQQLECLNEIQSQIEGRRRHDQDVGEQLRLLRQAVLECQRLHYDRKKTTASLHRIRESLAKTASTAAMSDASADGLAKLSSSVAADLQGLPSHLRELLLRPEYRSCLLDSKLLDFEESTDDPSGSFGVVHKGTYLGKPIAAKLLLNRDPTAQAVKELLDEALLLKQYNFDYFATVYGLCIVGDGDGKKSPAIVMKRMDSDLFRFLRRSDRQDLKQSLLWKLKTAVTIATAVEALHRLNILHRDLKSLNILVSGDDAAEIRITDFGMARVRREAASLRNSRTVQAGQHETVGSYPWMAPEIMRAGKYTDEADVFSLGVILWEVITWEEPWAHAVSVRAIENAVCSGNTLDTDGMPPGLASLLRKMWKKNPRDRLSAEEVVAGLTDFQKRHVDAPPTVPAPAAPAPMPPTSPSPSENLTQEDVEAGPSPPGPGAASGPRACRAKPRSVVLGLVFLVVAVVGAVVAVFASRGGGDGGADSSPPAAPSESFSPSDVPSLRPTLRPSQSANPSQSPSPSSSPSQSPLPSSPPSTYWSSLDWSRQGLGFNGASEYRFGAAVAFSADASTMAIGAPGPFGNDDRPGYVKVYGREGEGSSWEQRGGTIRGEANGDYFGHSLSLSEDGTILSIGAPQHDSVGPDSGQVKVYELDEAGSNYVQIGDTLYSAASGDRFGYSLDITSGKILAVGARSSDANGSDSGQVTIYAWDGASSNFKQRGEAIDGDAAGDDFGFSVSLAENGQKLAVGAIGSDSNGSDSGQVRLFEWVEATANYEQLGDSLLGDAAFDRFGWSVSFSRDGTTLAIGAPYNGENGPYSGQVKVFAWDEPASNLVQIGQSLFGKAASDRFGISVSLSSTGKTLAIGADQVSGTGYVEVYGRDEAASEYKRLGQSLGGEASGDRFGYALALAGNGRDLAVGAPKNDRSGTDSGRVEVFHIEL